MTFEECLDFVLEHEGGDRFTDDPRDPGGATKYGIAQNYHPGVDVKNLRRDGAAALYRKEYWETCRCDELPGGLRLAIFDAAVNAGCGNAIRFLQRALNVTADGIIGAITIRAAHAAATDIFASALTERILFYSSREGFSPYGRGWIRRCLDVQRTALLAQLGALGPVFKSN